MKNKSTGWIGLLAMIGAGVAWFARGAFNFDQDNQSEGDAPTFTRSVGAVVGITPSTSSLSAPVVYKTTPYSDYVYSVGATREAVARQQTDLAYQAVNNAIGMSTPITQEQYLAGEANVRQAQQQLGYDIVNKVIQPGLTSVDPAGRQSQVEYVMNNPDVANLLQQSAMLAQNQVQQQAIVAGQLAQAPEQSAVVSQTAYDIARAMGIIG